MSASDPLPVGPSGSSVGIPMNIPTISPHQLTFDSFSMNVKPFVLPRSIDSFRHPILVFDVPLSHPSYPALKQMLIHWMKQAKLSIGRSSPIDFRKAIDAGLSKLSKEKVYFADLRQQKDPELGLPIHLHPESWINNLAASLALDSFRALVVFTDSIETLPPCWASKSILGLSATESLGAFIRHGLGLPRSSIQPIKDNATKLCGYIKMIREHRMVEW